VRNTLVTVRPDWADHPPGRGFGTTYGSGFNGQRQESSSSDEGPHRGESPRSKGVSSNEGQRRVDQPDYQRVRGSSPWRRANTQVTPLALGFFMPATHSLRTQLPSSHSWPIAVRPLVSRRDAPVGPHLIVTVRHITSARNQSGELTAMHKITHLLDHWETRFERLVADGKYSPTSLDAYRRAIKNHIRPPQLGLATLGPPRGRRSRRTPLRQRR
jgi:hypothetical protein